MTRLCLQVIGGCYYSFNNTSQILKTFLVDFVHRKDHGTGKELLFYNTQMLNKVSFIYLWLSRSGFRFQVRLEFRLQTGFQIFVLGALDLSRGCRLLVRF